MISNTGIIIELANHSLIMCGKFKNVESTLLSESLNEHFSPRKFVTIPFTHRKSRIKRHPDGVSYMRHYQHNAIGIVNHKYRLQYKYIST